MGLYRMLLSKKIENWNIHIVLLDKECSEKIQITMQKSVDSVNNVYGLPSIEKAIQYLHVVQVFQQKQAL